MLTIKGGSNVVGISR